MTLLAIFDVDGTLVDSQALIVATVTAAFEAEGLNAPARSAVLSMVGLSLERMMDGLAGEQPEARRAALAAGYRAAYAAHRVATGAAAGSPLFPGAAEMLAHLANMPDVVLGVATGKSRRGLNALLAAHGLDRHFVTTQVADDHPSKPHPSMIFAALAEAGCAADQAVMIGDTTFDMDMAAAAGVAGLGVSWGYHPPTQLRHRASRMIDSFAEVPAALDQLWKVPS